MYRPEEREVAVADLALLRATRLGLDGPYAALVATLAYRLDPNSAHRAIEKALRVVRPIVRAELVLDDAEWEVNQ